MNRMLGFVCVWLLFGCAPAPAGLDAGRDAPIVAPATSCVQPGDEGNEEGVGRFCSPRGGQCATTVSARLCLADLAPDVGDWYCLRLCDTDADCGSGALCVGDARGRGCATLECIRAPDAGTDDAGSDDAGSPDAGSTDAAASSDAPAPTDAAEGDAP